MQLLAAMAYNPVNLNPDVLARGYVGASWWCSDDDVLRVFAAVASRHSGKERQRWQRRRTLRYSHSMALNVNSDEEMNGFN